MSGSAKVYSKQSNEGPARYNSKPPCWSIQILQSHLDDNISNIMLSVRIVGLFHHEIYLSSIPKHLPYTSNSNNNASRNTQKHSHHPTSFQAFRTWCYSISRKITIAFIHLNQHHQKQKAKRTVARTDWTAVIIVTKTKSWPLVQSPSHHLSYSYDL